MGGFHGAEVCQIVGLFILSKIKNSGIISSHGQIGLYRDDLLIVDMVPARIAEHQMKPQLIELFQRLKLGLEQFVIGRRVCFLDVMLDLEKEIYQPYRKPNEVTVYVSRESNHAPSVIEAIPKE